MAIHTAFEITCDNHDPYTGACCEFYISLATTETTAKAEAKAQGWKFPKYGEDGEAVCPKCYAGNPNRIVEMDETSRLLNEVLGEES